MPLQLCPVCSSAIYPLGEDEALAECERRAPFACRFHAGVSPYRSGCDFTCAGVESLEAHEGQCRLQGVCGLRDAARVSAEVFRFWEGNAGVCVRGAAAAALALEAREGLGPGLAQRLFSPGVLSDAQFAQPPTSESLLLVRVIVDGPLLEQQWEISSAQSRLSTPADGPSASETLAGMAAERPGEIFPMPEITWPNFQVVVFWNPAQLTAGISQYNQAAAGIALQFPDGSQQLMQIFLPHPDQLRQKGRVYRLWGKTECKTPGRIVYDARVALGFKGGSGGIIARHCTQKIVSQTAVVLEDRANVSDMLRSTDEALSLFSAGLQMGADIVSRGVEGIVQYVQHRAAQTARVSDTSGASATPLPPGQPGQPAKTLGHNALTLESSSSSSLAGESRAAEGSRSGPSSDGSSQDGSAEDSTPHPRQFRFSAEELNLGDLNSLLCYGQIGVTVRDTVAFLVGLRGLCFTPANARLFSCASALDTVCGLLDRFPATQIVQKTGSELLLEMLARGIEPAALRAKYPGISGRITRACLLVPTEPTPRRLAQEMGLEL